MSGRWYVVDEFGDTITKSKSGIKRHIVGVSLTEWVSRPRMQETWYREGMKTLPHRSRLACAHRSSHGTAVPHVLDEHQGSERIKDCNVACNPCLPVTSGSLPPDEASTVAHAFATSYRGLPPGKLRLQNMDSEWASA